MLGQLVTEIFKELRISEFVVSSLLLSNSTNPPSQTDGRDGIKDGAYYCYCAYVLRISRYSDFLSPMLTNTGIFLRGLKLSGESRS